jgi:hypothetical protein
MKILDFSNGQNIPDLFIVNPGYSIANRNVSIEFKDKGLPTFSVMVGCQTVHITPENIDKILMELKGEELPSTMTQVIVPIGTNPKTASPKLISEVGQWLISKDKKAFEKEKFEVKEISIKEKRRYFIPGGRYESSGSVHFRGLYRLSKNDEDNILFILSKIQEHFSGE